MKHCHLKKTDFLFIEMNDREKPNKTERGEHTFMYEEKLDHWTQSLRVYRVASEQEDLFLAYVSNYETKREMDSALSEGIDFDPNRLEFYVGYEDSENPSPMYGGVLSTGNQIQMVRLKPVESGDYINVDKETIAKGFQKECHRTVELILSQNKNSDYQDATNCFMFRKLAELQLQINALTRK